MQLTDFTLHLIVLFLPGLIATYLVEELTIHKPRTSLIIALECFAFGMGSYFTYYLLLYLFGLCCFCHACESPKVIFFDALQDANVKVSFAEVIRVCFVGILVGLSVTGMIEHKLLSKMAHKLRLTKKFAEFDVWGYAFNAPNTAMDFITVRDIRNNLVFDGWVNAFSDDSLNSELLIRDVAVYYDPPEGGLIFQYQVGAIYLARKREDITIEFRGIPINSEHKIEEEVIGE